MSVSDVICKCGAEPERDSMGQALPCMRCYFSSSDLPPDMTPEQRAEYQRYLASPAGTARALVEARAEIERLKARQLTPEGRLPPGAADLIEGLEREAMDLETKLTAAESQIAALKVELAAMMKERDEARKLATARLRNWNLKSANTGELAPWKIYADAPTMRTLQIPITEEDENDDAIVSRLVNKASDASVESEEMKGIFSGYLDQGLSLKDSAIQVFADRDKYKWQAKERLRLWNEEVSRLRAHRDAALAELGQVRAERDDKSAQLASSKEAHDRLARQVESWVPRDTYAETVRLVDQLRGQCDAAVKRAKAAEARLKTLLEMDAARWAGCEAHEQGIALNDSPEIRFGPNAHKGDAWETGWLLGAGNKARAELRQMREENARLKAAVSTSVNAHADHATALEANYGRAVAALRIWIDAPFFETREGWEQWAMPLRTEIRAILANASATQAADAWRAQQEERDKEIRASAIRECIFAAKGQLEDGYGEGTVRDVINSLEALTARDARRAGGKDGAK